mgnify:FL=1
MSFTFIPAQNAKIDLMNHRLLTCILVINQTNILRIILTIYSPVEPNPPSPRAVVFRLSTISTSKS